MPVSLLLTSHSLGSYTLQWPIDGTTTRMVRLILIELVGGTSMQQLSPLKFSQRYCQDIMKAVIDAETSLYTSKTRKVTIIDFGKTRLGRTPYPAGEQQYLSGVPISPLSAGTRLGDFGMPLMPESIGTGNFWLEDVYEDTRASITDRMRIVWLPPILTQPLEPLPDDNESE
ncbi:hypothetical protein GX51_01619 [Blastomyces parvus]|uniref:Protein kinase domain-containing protein n=1 Tax=Blastomyces parvus TaxID=2060905 RepID=A0A2B7XFR0_9EURO|nr:hypothetical protein GX51_01619 [Blastomyces parvus]